MICRLVRKEEIFKDASQKALCRTWWIRDEHYKQISLNICQQEVHVRNPVSLAMLIRVYCNDRDSGLDESRRDLQVVQKKRPCHNASSR